MLGAGGGDPLQVEQPSKQTGRRAAEQATEQAGGRVRQRRCNEEGALLLAQRKDATDKERSLVEERSTQL